MGANQFGGLEGARVAAFQANNNMGNNNNSDNNQQQQQGDAEDGGAGGASMSGGDNNTSGSNKTSSSQGGGGLGSGASQGTQQQHMGTTVRDEIEKLSRDPRKRELYRLLERMKDSDISMAAVARGAGGIAQNGAGPNSEGGVGASSGMQLPQKKSFLDSSQIRTYKSPDIDDDEEEDETEEEGEDKMELGEVRREDLGKLLGVNMSDFELRNSTNNKLIVTATMTSTTTTTATATAITTIQNIVESAKSTPQKVPSLRPSSRDSSVTMTANSPCSSPQPSLIGDILPPTLCPKKKFLDEFRSRSSSIGSQPGDGMGDDMNFRYRSNSLSAGLHSQMAHGDTGVTAAVLRADEQFRQRSSTVASFRPSLKKRLLAAAATENSSGSPSRIEPGTGNDVTNARDSTHTPTKDTPTVFPAPTPTPPSTSAAASAAQGSPPTSTSATTAAASGKGPPAKMMNVKTYIDKIFESEVMKMHLQQDSWDSPPATPLNPQRLQQQVCGVMKKEGKETTANKSHIQKISEQVHMLPKIHPPGPHGGRPPQKDPKESAKDSASKRQNRIERNIQLHSNPHPHPSSIPPQSHPSSHAPSHIPPPLIAPQEVRSWPSLSLSSNHSTAFHPPTSLPPPAAPAALSLPPPPRGPSPISSHVQDAPLDLSVKKPAAELSSRLPPSPPSSQYSPSKSSKSHSMASSRSSPYSPHHPDYSPHSHHHHHPYQLQQPQHHSAAASSAAASSASAASAAYHSGSATATTATSVYSGYLSKDVSPTTGYYGYGNSHHSSSQGYVAHLPAPPHHHPNPHHPSVDYNDPRSSTSASSSASSPYSSSSRHYPQQQPQHHHQQPSPGAQQHSVAASQPQQQHSPHSRRHLPSMPSAAASSASVASAAARGSHYSSTTSQQQQQYPHHLQYPPPPSPQHHPGSTVHHQGTTSSVHHPGGSRSVPPPPQQNPSPVQQYHGGSSAAVPSHSRPSSAVSHPRDSTAHHSNRSISDESYHQVQARMAMEREILQRMSRSNSTSSSTSTPTHPHTAPSPHHSPRPPPSSQHPVQHRSSATGTQGSAGATHSSSHLTPQQLYQQRQQELAAAAVAASRGQGHQGQGYREVTAQHSLSITGGYKQSSASGHGSSSEMILSASSSISSPPPSSSTSASHKAPTAHQQLLGDHPPEDILFLKCNLCNSTFGSLHNFRRHFAKVHGPQLNNQHITIHSISQAKSERAAAAQRISGGGDGGSRGEDDGRSPYAQGGPRERDVPPRSMSGPEIRRDSSSSSYSTDAGVDRDNNRRYSHDEQQRRYLPSSEDQQQQHSRYSIDEHHDEMKSKSATSLIRDEQHTMKCLLCGMEFPTSDWGVFRRHMRTHEGGGANNPGGDSTDDSNSPLSCIPCKLTFSDSEKWRLHMSLAHGTHACICPLCDTGFASGDALHKHMKSGIHSGNRTSPDIGGNSNYSANYNSGGGKYYNHGESPHPRERDAHDRRDCSTSPRSHPRTPTSSSSSSSYTSTTNTNSYITTPTATTTISSKYCCTQCSLTFTSEHELYAHSRARHRADKAVWAGGAGSDSPPPHVRRATPDSTSYEENGSKHGDDKNSITNILELIEKKVIEEHRKSSNQQPPCTAPPKKRRQHPDYSVVPPKKAAMMASMEGMDHSNAFDKLVEKAVMKEFAKDKMEQSSRSSSPGSLMSSSSTAAANKNKNRKSPPHALASLPNAALMSTQSLETASNTSTSSSSSSKSQQHRGRSGSGSEGSTRSVGSEGSKSTLSNVASKDVMSSIIQTMFITYPLMNRGSGNQNVRDVIEKLVRAEVMGHNEAANVNGPPTTMTSSSSPSRSSSTSTTTNKTMVKSSPCMDASQLEKTTKSTLVDTIDLPFRQIKHTAGSRLNQGKDVCAVLRSVMHGNSDSTASRLSESLLKEKRCMDGGVSVKTEVEEDMDTDSNKTNSPLHPSMKTQIKDEDSKSDLKSDLKPVVDSPSSIKNESESKMELSETSTGTTIEPTQTKIEPDNDGNDTDDDLLERGELQIDEGVSDSEPEKNEPESCVEDPQNEGRKSDQSESSSQVTQEYNQSEGLSDDEGGELRIDESQSESELKICESEDEMPQGS